MIALPLALGPALVPAGIQVAKPDAPGLIGNRGTLAGDLSLLALVVGAGILLTADTNRRVMIGQSLALRALCGLIGTGAVRVYQERTKLLAP